MISADSKYRAALAANCIISTAPMPKLGAISTPTSGLWDSQLRTRSRRCSVKPLVPTTTLMPWSMAPVQVVHHHVRGGEVDEHLRGRVGGVEQPVALVDHRHELEVVGGVDRPADLGTHAAPGAQHPYADRFTLVSHRLNLSHRPGGHSTSARRYRPDRNVPPT